MAGSDPQIEASMQRPLDRPQDANDIGPGGGVERLQREPVPRLNPLLLIGLRTHQLRCVVVADTHCPIEGGVLGDGILPLVIELAARPVDVDVALCTLMPIALSRSVLCDPAELPRVVRVQFAIERSVVTLVLRWRVYPFLGCLRAGVLQSQSLLCLVIHLFLLL